MKKIAALGAFLALFLLTGCPEKQVNVEQEGEGANAQVEVNQPTSTTDDEPAQVQSTQQQPQEDSLVESIYFDFDKFNIRADMQSSIDKAAEEISQAGNAKVVIEGNTDEFGTDEYNYALGTKRAIATRDALVVKGINKGNVRVVSFGESKPICTAKTKECYQKNRRSDIKIVK
ncbi:OmpA family protein [Helicobacter fennelliae]|uniref:Peptidoglycan-associated lipoprotein n=1 Tax=Helicobacter fennelliae MRY12-0050 TaxID=1325130 RepID=T1DV66_9HELI|nr:OmpA family protein [Helicobacter fennelliae]GAD18463.1 outer membrane lipoprotein omp16 precursor [Helicobacter fennelliae MRY12-0050]STP08170.1 peptidoglycan-associated lipoprotein [Helicobacter fennelliae]STQ83922.1 peptidoglycan-associated lipoprotein [Helicobacter fennelliae]